jgi:hypothetical protein
MSKNSRPPPGPAGFSLRPFCELRNERHLRAMICSSGVLDEARIGMIKTEQEVRNYAIGHRMEGGQKPKPKFWLTAKRMLRGAACVAALCPGPIRSFSLIIPPSFPGSGRRAGGLYADQRTW